jgi:ATP-dependent Clp protease ATP-binding subunit ClpC
MGSFIFVGPSGVGKTLSGQGLAEFMFGDPDALMILDMSEYMEKHNVPSGRRASGLRRL